MKVATEEVKSEETVETPKKKKKLTLLIVLLVSITLVGVTAFIFKDQLLNSGSSEGETTEKVIEESEAKFEYLVEEMSVKLADKTDKEYLKASVLLKFADESLVALLEEKTNDINATINEVLRTKFKDDVRTIEQTRALQDEVKEAINELLGDDYILEVRFPKFLI